MTISKKWLIRLGIGGLAGALLICGGVFTFQQSRYKLSEDEAKSIAIKNAGVRMADATFVRVEKDTDDWQATYDIEFYTKDGDFDYVIDAETGSILERDNDLFEVTTQAAATTTQAQENSGQNQTTTAPAASPSGGISQDEAKNKALADAGLEEKNVAQLFVQMDMDNGITYYEVDFNDPATNMDYDYTIDAETGEIVERSQEPMLD